jgi:mycoredoxin
LTDHNTLTPSKIVMYTTDYCSDCFRVKAFFDSNNIEYVQIRLEENPQATEFVLNVNKGNRSVPTIIFPDGSVLVEPGIQELREKTAQFN